MEDGADSAGDVEQRELYMGSAQHGQRLDRALADLVPEFSRSYLRQLIEAAAVRVKGQAVTKPSTHVRVGECVVVELRPTQQSQAFKPQAMALEVVFEDAHLRVIHKPAGLVVHPAPGNWSGTLLNGLLARDPQAQFLPRAGIVHRLDKDTSGLMVVARTRAVMDALVRMIAAREVSRQYLALAHGTWGGPDAQRAQWPIGRDPRNRLRMAAVDLTQHSGKAACTDIELLQNCAQGCLVRCILHTGRTHQIRVHMLMLGHPLVADALYGGAPAAGIQRQALHAFRLALAHPVTGQALDFRSTLPRDMREALQAWGLGYNEP
ncbi:MAG: RluA family pseudouridine synthase [Betaproteobacteria bacterium]